MFFLIWIVDFPCFFAMVSDIIGNGIGCFLSRSISKIHAPHRILDFIDDLKEKLEIQSKKKRSDSKRLHEKGEEVKKHFALDENDIENIFDILEKEHPEL